MSCLPEEFVACVRPVNLRMADRAVPVALIREIVGHLRRAGRVFSGHCPNVAVTFDTQLSHVAASEQLGIGRAVRIVTCGAAFDLYRRMLEHEWALFVRVALDASSIGSCCESCLLLLEASVWVMAVAALHSAFEHPVMERPVKLRLGFVVTGHAELSFVFSQQVLRREVAGVCREGSDWQ